MNETNKFTSKKLIHVWSVDKECEMIVIKWEIRWPNDQPNIFYQCRLNISQRFQIVIILIKQF